MDQVLVMTVNPGFGHQHFLRTTLGKIGRVRQMIEQVKPDCDLEVDGGIDEETAPLAVAAGASVLVAGTSVFGDCQGVAAAMKRLKAAANSAVNKTKEIGGVDYEKEDNHATWDDWTGPDGRQHGAPAH